MRRAQTLGTLKNRNPKNKKTLYEIAAYTKLDREWEKKQRPKLIKKRKEELYKKFGENFMTTRLLRFQNQGENLKKPKHLGDFNSSDQYFSSLVSKDLQNPGFYLENIEKSDFKQEVPEEGSSVVIDKFNMVNHISKSKTGGFRSTRGHKKFTFAHSPEMNAEKIMEKIQEVKHRKHHHKPAKMDKSSRLNPSSKPNKSTV